MPSRIGRRGRGGVAVAAGGGGRAGVVQVVGGGGGGGTADTPGGGVAPAMVTTPYVELGFRGLGWRWWGYSSEVPGYIGGYGGWWERRWVGPEPSCRGRIHGEEEDGWAEEDVA
jgi:hypothetical protein